MKTIDFLQTHRSIRKYSSEKIAPELLQNIFAAGQSAASSSFVQAYSVIRISDSAIREKLAELAGNQGYIQTCAEFLVCCADLRRNKKVCESLDGDSEPSYVEQLIVATVDTALMAQNMVVAAESEGLGICYIGGIRNNIGDVTELLAIPKYVYPVFGLCLGYPDQDPEPKPRLPQSACFMENRYVETKPEDIERYDQQLSRYYMKRTDNKKSSTWSDEIRGHFTLKTRPHMLEFLHKQELGKR